MQASNQPKLEPEDSLTPGEELCLNLSSYIDAFVHALSDSEMHFGRIIHRWFCQSNGRC